MTSGGGKVEAKSSTNVTQIWNSLYAHVQRQKTTDKHNIIHRIVYVAKIRRRIRLGDPNNPTADYYKAMVAKLNQNIFAEGVTGMLLSFRGCIIHIFESTEEVQKKVLDELIEMETNEQSLLTDVKILTISYCLEKRLFPRWQFHALEKSFNDPDMAETLPPEEECLSLIYQLCARLLDGQDVKPEDLIREDTVLSLCQSRLLLSPSEHRQYHSKVIDTMLKSESEKGLPWQPAW